MARYECECELMETSYSRPRRRRPPTSSSTGLLQFAQCIYEYYSYFYYYCWRRRLRRGCHKHIASLTSKLAAIYYILCNTIQYNSCWRLCNKIIMHACKSHLNPIAMTLCLPPQRMSKGSKGGILGDHVMR